MKRSGGVTAAAMVLIVVSAVLCLGAFFAALGLFLAQQMGPKLPSHAFVRTVVDVGAFVCVTIWGIVTGIGLVRLRRWSWFCILAIGGLLVACAIPGLVQAHKLIRATTGVPTVGAHGFIVTEYVGLGFTVLVPLALAIWWLLLFTRRSVRVQFATGEHLAESVAAPEFFAVRAMPAHEDGPFVSPKMQLSYRRPVSITVIAVLLLCGLTALPAIFLYPARLRITVMFGILLTGRKMVLATLPWIAADVALGIGLLRLKPWARIGTIVYCIVSLANGALSASKIGALMSAMNKAIGIAGPPLPATFQHFVEIFGMVFAIALNGAGIYFLMTRRTAFQPPAANGFASGSAAAPFDASRAASQGG